MYVPVTRMGLVQKYVGGYGAQPTLSKVGGAAWGRRKEAVKNVAAAVGKKIANPIYEEVGEVDWSQGVIRATGYGVMPTESGSYAQGQLLALDAAQLDAERNLAATIAGLKIKARRHSDRHTVDEYDIEETVRAKLKGARVVEVRNQPDGSVEVEMEIGLHRRNAPEA